MFPLQLSQIYCEKAKRNKKNIETNTKTRLTFDKDAILAVRKNDFVSKKKTNIQISSEILDDDEEIAKKHVKAAKLMIRKMVQAFQENPDYFVRKAGGTFAEQDEAKKRKAEVIQKLQQKKNNANAENDDIVPKQSGKKKRKFY